MHILDMQVESGVCYTQNHHIVYNAMCGCVCGCVCICMHVHMCVCVMCVLGVWVYGCA